MLTWQDPPADRRGAPANKPRIHQRHDWELIAATLRERPGAWALLDEVRSPRTASLINQGRIADLPADRFEALIRRDGTAFRVFARYTGGNR